MKKVYYILLILLSIAACSQEGKHKKEVAPSSKKEVSITTPIKANESEYKEDTILKNRLLDKKKPTEKVKSDNADVLYFSKETTAANTSKQEVSKQKKGLTTEIKAVFDESAAQKLQQLLDIAALAQDSKQSKEMKAYAKTSAQNYYADSKKNIDNELKTINAIQADSIVIEKMQKKFIKHIKNNYYQVAYTATVNYYKQNKLTQSKKKTIDFQFEIVKLNLDGQLFSTIESRILSVK